MEHLRRIIIWGTSGHAKVVAEIVQLLGNYEIVGFLDDFRASDPNARFLDIPILGGRDQLAAIRKLGVRHALFGFGDPVARLACSRILFEEGFDMPTAIHPRAIVSPSASIGAGTVIVAGAVVSAGAIARNNVIINTGASVDHDCVIEEGAHICPGVRLAGNVTVGGGTWVGIGSTVIQKVRIGHGTIIGAASLVLKDIPNGVVAYGVPARVIRKVES